MSRKTVCLAILSATLLVGCSGSNNPFSSSKKTETSSTPEQVITTADVPASVLDAFRRDHPYATVTRVGRQNFKDGRTYYVFHYNDREGKAKTDSYNARAMKVTE
jgi:hypothetical protein